MVSRVRVFDCGRYDSLRELLVVVEVRASPTNHVAGAW